MRYSTISAVLATLIATVVADDQLHNHWQVRGFEGEQCFGKVIYDSDIQDINTDLPCTKFNDSLAITTQGTFGAGHRFCAYPNDECTPGTSLIGFQGDNTTFGDCATNTFKSIKVITGEAGDC